LKVITIFHKGSFRNMLNTTFTMQLEVYMT